MIQLAVVAVMVVFCAGLLIGLVIGGSAAGARAVPVQPGTELERREMAHLRAALTHAHAELQAERTYSGGLRAELTGQRLTIGELKARIDISKAAS